VHLTSAVNVNVGGMRGGSSETRREVDETHLGVDQSMAFETVTKLHLLYPAPLDRSTLYSFH
jgi:hypothetical protein